MDLDKITHTFNKKSVREKMQYNVGDKVFARVRGFPPWPARIVDPVKIALKNSVYSVFFYGTKQSAKVQSVNLYPFIEMKHMLGRERKVKYFNESMTAILKDLSEKEKLKLTQIEKTQILKNTNNAPNTNDKNLVRKRKMKNFKKPIRSVSRYGRKFKPKVRPDTSDKPKIPKTKSVECGPTQMDEESESNNDNTMNDDKTFVLSIDQKNKESILNELNLVEWEVELVRSLSISNPQPVIASEILDKMNSLEITEVMVHKYPDIIGTLMKVRRYHNNKNPEEFPPEVDEIIREKSEKILARIERLFKVPKGMDFMEHFKRLHNEFSLKTAALSPHELLKLY